MHIYIVGSGKLATELLTALPAAALGAVQAWQGDPGDSNDADDADAVGNPRRTDGLARAVVIHAGSGRALPALSDYCRRTGAVLLELSTGSVLEEPGAAPGFPVVLCPNTNILMLKFMAMLARSGALFAGYDIRLTESHQATKTSVPGTAVAMAQSLGLAAEAITSVRDPAVQAGQLGIPASSLARHAFHRLEIADGACQVRMETRVQGDAPYANGVRQIVQAVAQHPLESRVYSVNEFIENGWL